MRYLRLMEFLILKISMEFYEISEIKGVLDTKDINGILFIVKYLLASEISDRFYQISEISITQMAH